jgi:hypothetical protein
MDQPYGNKRAESWTVMSAKKKKVKKQSLPIYLISKGEWLNFS